MTGRATRRRRRPRANRLREARGRRLAVPSSGVFLWGGGWLQPGGLPLSAPIGTRSLSVSHRPVVRNETGARRVANANTPAHTPMRSRTGQPGGWVTLLRPAPAGPRRRGRCALESVSLVAEVPRTTPLQRMGRPVPRCLCEKGVLVWRGRPSAGHDARLERAATPAALDDPSVKHFFHSFPPPGNTRQPASFRRTHGEQKRVGDCPKKKKKSTRARARPRNIRRVSTRSHPRGRPPPARHPAPLSRSRAARRSQTWACAAAAAQTWRCN